MVLKSKIRSVYYFALCTVLMLNMSCASKPEKKDDPISQANAAADELAGEPGGIDSLADMEAQGDKGMQALEDELAALDSNADTLLGEELGDDVPKAEEKAENSLENFGMEEVSEQEMFGDLEKESGDDLLAGIETKEEPAPPSDDFGMGAEMDSPSMEGPDPALAGIDEIQKNDNLGDTVSFGNDGSLGFDNIPTTEAPSFGEEPSFGSAPKVVNSATPVIPESAFEKDGQWLNRFYFVRKGDTAQSISSLLLGNANEGPKLAATNGGMRRLSLPGALLFYTSPSQPTDNQMRSFYQENNIQAEEYTVGKGEWLSLIAKKLYGDIRSWKELAVVNGLADPDAVSRGQKLFAYPSDLTTQLVANSQPVVEEPSIPEPSIPEPEEPKQMAQAPEAEPMAKTPAPAPMPKKPMPPARPAANSEEEDAMGKALKLFQQNLTAIAIFSVIGVCFIFLLVVNKRRRARAADDFEQDYVEPPKARRK